MRIRNYFLFLVFLGLLFLTGCSEKSNNLLISQDNGVTATLTIEPSTPVSMENTRFMITLMEGDQPVKGADMILNLTMPGMKMPENKINAVEKEPGSYSNTTLLSMAGDWHLQADVTHNAKVYTFDFDFKAK
ncbi:MAG: hypothetical protein CL609_15260 [Anaerolineaceae bacterium]|nr:hypothetical protein [Anaerolineaceae bacterium]